MEQRSRRLGELSLDGLIGLEDGDALDLLPSASPLSLLSPNSLHRTRPAKSPAKTSDSLSELPGFKARRKPDPRRQSTAIFASFAQATAGAGLLEDDEIAVGDDDILISLPKAAKSHLVGNNAHLWLDPHTDTDDLLSGDLPEPDLFGAAADCGIGLGSAALGGLGGLEPIPESPGHDDAEPPVCCASPQMARRTSPTKRVGSRGTSPQKLLRGMRDSTAITEGLSKLCLEAGLTDLDDEDFELQDGNKVKEMAILFKMEADAKAVSSPKGDTVCSSLPSSPMGAEEPGAVPFSGAASPTATGNSVRERVQQLQNVAKPEEQAMQKPARQPPSTSRLSDGGSNNKAAAPTARPSRLRPPSTSSSYFSHSVTEPRAGGPAAAQPQRSRLPSSKGPGAATTRQPVAAASAATARGSTTMQSQRAVGRATAPAAAPSPARAGLARPSTAPASPAMSSRQVSSPGPRLGQAANCTSSSAAARAPAVRSRLGQPSSVQPLAAHPCGRAAEAAAGAEDAEAPRRGMFSQRTLGAAVSRLKPPTAPSTSTPTRATPAIDGPLASKLQLPKLHMSSPMPSPDSMTPNTARIRFLEQHPELVFGGAQRVNNSPMGQEQGQQPVRRKTAEERHLEEWGDHL